MSADREKVTEEEKLELEQLWEDAIRRYSEEANKTFDARKWRPRVKTPEDLEALIQDDSTQFSKFRASHGRLWNMFGSTMRHLRSFGSMVQAGVGMTPFAPASVIVEAALWLIDAGSAVSDTYDALEELFKKIEDSADRLDEYLQGTIDRKLRKVVINFLCSLLRVFCEAEKAIKRGRGREMLRRVAGKENKVQNALDDCNQAWKTEMGLIAAKTYVTTQRMDKRADADIDQRLLHDTLAFDTAEDMKRRYRTIEDTRLPESGNWLLQEPLFKKWVSKEFPVLWILGNPGVGKSYLAARVISHLREAHQQHPDHGVVGYFFVTEAMQTQYSPQTVLTTFASQITKDYDAYRKHALSVCKDSDSFLSHILVWNNLFVEFFRQETSHPVFLVIDGFDEAVLEHQRLLTKMAKELSDLRLRSPFPLVQILLVGRHDIEYTITNVWAGARKRPKVITIMPSKSKADITRFVRKRVEEDIPLLVRMIREPSRARKRDARVLRKEIIHEISHSADGMFMMAKLMLDEIKDMNKPELIREALSRPPSGLGDMFNRIVTRLVAMGGFDKNDLNELLIWVGCAKRDLLLGELDLILKIRDLNQNGLVGLADELRTRFGSFFKVVEKEVGSEEVEEDPPMPEQGLDAASMNAAEKPVNAEEEDHDPGDWSDVGSDISGSDATDCDDSVPPEFLTTTVKFSHASVGQHFRNRGFHRGIGMNLNLARARILKICVLNLTGKIHTQDGSHWRLPDLKDYSADHFLDHLVEVDLEALKGSNIEEYNAISHEISLLFRRGEDLVLWYKLVSDSQKLIHQLFTPDPILSCIQKWIPDPEVSATTSRSEERWLRNAKASSQDLLRPFAKAMVKSWVVEDEVDDIMAVLFLNAYFSMGDQSKQQWKLYRNRSFKQQAEGISPERICAFATAFQFERTVGWHLTLSATLTKIGAREHLKRALVEVQRAKRKGGKIASTHTTEAYILYKLENFREAIAAAHKALKLLPRYSYNERETLLEILVESYWHVQDAEAAVKVALEVSQRVTWSILAARRLIQAFFRTGRYQDIVLLLKSKMEQQETDFLSRLMSLQMDQSVIELISIAGAKSGRLDDVRDVFAAVVRETKELEYSRAAQAAKSSLAHLYFQHYRDDEKAVSLWESVVKDKSGTTPIPTIALSTLASLYYTKATEAERVGNDPLPWILKLQEMARWTEGKGSLEALEKCGDDDERRVRTQMWTMLGKWYAAHGKTELAREIIQPVVERAMEIWTAQSAEFQDECWAQMTLGQCLNAIGDRKNAMIAWTFTLPFELSKEAQDFDAEESSKQQQSQNPDSERLRRVWVPFNFTAWCDGRCGRNEVSFKSLSKCEICVDIDFCDECLPKVQNGTLDFRVCDKSHTFVERYPPKGLVIKTRDGFMVRNDGEWISAEDWLQSIKHEWVVKKVERVVTF